MLEAFFTGIFKCLWILGAAILGILYILSPLDIIPDVIPIIGWLDDLGVAGWLIKPLFSSIYRHIALWVLIIPGGVGLLAYLVLWIIMPYDEAEDIYDDEDLDNMKSANPEENVSSSKSSGAKKKSNTIHSDEEFNDFFKK